MISQPTSTRNVNDSLQSLIEKSHCIALLIEGDVST